MRPAFPPLSTWPRSTGWVVAANLVPLAGVLFLGWHVGEVLFLYWLENLVIGGSTVVKMARSRKAAAFFFVPFFLGHYGVFMAAHLIFLVALFDASPTKETVWPFLALLASHVHAHHQEGGTAREPSALMLEPYPRIFALHVTIIAGGLLVLALGEPRLAVACLVALKIAIEVVAGRRGSREQGVPAASPP